MPTPQQHALLAGIAAKLEAAGHGERAPIYQQACSELGVAMQTLHRWLAPHRHTGR
jgi:hypothetical protein